MINRYDSPMVNLDAARRASAATRRVRRKRSGIVNYSDVAAGVAYAAGAGAHVIHLSLGGVMRAQT